MHNVLHNNRPERDRGVPRRLIQRNGIWHYLRRVPARFADVDRRTYATISLETRDLSRAERMKAAVERDLETYWIALKRGASQDANERYIGAIERARLEGFEYRSLGELTAGDLAELRRRIDRLAELFPGGYETDDPPDAVQAAAEAALLGTAEMPALTLSKALEQFESLTRDKVRRKSPDQLRRWRAPRLKAVNNLIALVGDKEIRQLTRSDALAFRAWWVERVVSEGYTPNSANKDIGHLAQIVETLSDALELGMGKPFAKLRIADNVKAQRAAFTTEQLLEIATDPRHLAGMNRDARGIVRLMVETGLRPSEICGLDETTIVLDDDVPHVLVRPGERDLKTPYSERAVPLVGVSLEAAREHPKGFPRYRDRSSQLSATVNKHLRARGLLPTDDHSLYSIRHSFQDRLTAADMPDRMQADLMGHKFNRPRYGEGPTLKHKHEWLLRLAITAEPRPADPDQMRLL